MFAVPTKRVRSVIRKDVVKKYIAAVKTTSKILETGTFAGRRRAFSVFCIKCF